MTTFLRIAASLLLAGIALPGLAMNRCVTPTGRILYTDASCDSVGAKPHGEVKGGISVVPGPPLKIAPPRPAPPMPTAEAVPGRSFRKSPKAPVLTVCYDPRDARADAAQGDVEASIRRAFSLWNAGCNITYEFVGQCPVDDSQWRRDFRPADYKVWWTSWDNSLTLTDDPRSTARDHAIAAASPTIGVSLNRDVSVPPWRLQRAIMHEFGHVVGIGHSRDPGDLMFSGGKQQTPTGADLDACNRAVEIRYGVKAAEN